MTNSTLGKNNVGLYSVLRETDILLSDYSSVIVDYLLLNKPIAMVFSDMSDYKENRGFHFNNIEEYMPGPIISCYDELVEYFINCEMINDKWEKKRIMIRNTFNDFDDGNNSKRVCDMFFGNKE